MDKLEYISGDLVMTNGVPLGTAKDVVYRVVSSDPSKTLKLEDGTVLKGVVCLENIEGAEFGDKGFLSGDSCAWVKDIVPVPLTPFIAEKIGWRNTKRHIDEDGFDWYIFSKDGILPELYYHSANRTFSVFICEEEVFPYLKFVHQLQHLLFGLGLNSEMEV